MLKKVLIGAVTVLSLGTVFFLNTGTTEAVSNVKIDEAGNVLLIADDEETDGITAVQLRLNVDSYADVEVSFEFNPENSIKISEYRYHEDIGALHIYIADSKPLFDGVESLDIGTILAVDTDGNAVDVQIEVAEDALKYVHQNTLMEDDVEVDIVTKPIVTPEATTSTTTTTAESTTITSTTTTAKSTTMTSTTTTAEPMTITSTTTTAEST
ncbi:MAG: hypothetical protein K2J37_03305, partial [Ruminococcus sp.]|nr:hypothetical protein [Ruminococcus sp.]